MRILKKNYRENPQSYNLLQFQRKNKYLKIFLVKRYFKKSIPCRVQ